MANKTKFGFEKSEISAAACENNPLEIECLQGGRGGGWIGGEQL
jgi:hypothetical protein